MLLERGPRLAGHLQGIGLRLGLGGRGSESRSGMERKMGISLSGTVRTGGGLRLGICRLTRQPRLGRGSAGGFLDRDGILQLGSGGGSNRLQGIDEGHLQADARVQCRILMSEVGAARAED